MMLARIVRYPASSTSHRWSRFSSSSSSSSSSTRVPHLTLYTAPDCSLCDVVKDVLKQAQSESPPFTIEYYNIRDDGLADVKRWRRAYQYDIPVLHLNGKEIARHRLDKEHLLAQLQLARAAESRE